MTSVSVAVTPSPGLIDGARPEATAGPAFALYVGVDESTGLDGRIRLAELAQAIDRLVEQHLPAATSHSALALGTRGSRRRAVHDLGAALATPLRGSASARAEAAWGTRETRVVVD